MSWARLDDLYDDHPKLLAAISIAPLAAAVHAHAISASARRSSDGLVDPFWLLARIPDERERQQVLDVLRELALFDRVPAGETRELSDAQGYRVTLGPWAEDRWLVHDFLEYNPSSAQIAERRERDNQRKRNPRGVQTESLRSPNGIHAESLARALPRPDPSQSLKSTPPARAGATRARTTGRRNPSIERGGTQQARDAEVDQLRRNRELCAHFPEIPSAVVLHVARRLSENGEPASIDAIRAHLEDDEQ